MNSVFVQTRVPHPMERREEEWVREEEEESMISLNVSVPVDVMVQSGEWSDTVSVIVKDSRVSV